MFINNGNFCSVTGIQIFGETPINHMKESAFLTDQEIIYSLNWTNKTPGFGLHAEKCWCLVSFNIYLVRLLPSLKAKNDTFLLVLPPCSSTQWSTTQRRQYTIWSAMTPNVGGHLLISNINHLTATDLSLLEPLWKEQACSWWMQCFALKGQMVSFLSESEAGDYLVPILLYFKHRTSSLTVRTWK